MEGIGKLKGDHRARHALRITSIAGLCVVASAIANGQVIHDGSRGAAGAIAGPNYAIPASRGQLVGANLFHSFSRFSVGAGERATFQSPGSVRNVLARVTSGARSEINGTLASETPGANLFLINPSGVMFGAGARLAVNGSFAVSTADVVKLSDGGRFNSNLIATDDLLTTADPSAFGFTSQSPGRVSFTGVAGNRALLNVPQGQTLSVIAGKVRLEQARLKAPSGRIHIAALQSAGEVAIDSVDVNASKQAAVVLERGSEITVDGAPGGSVVIKGGQIILAKTKANITAQSFGSADGGGIEIRAIHDFILLGQSNVMAMAHGAGKGGDISITAHRVTLDGLGADASVFGVVGGTDGAGRGADVLVKADSLVIRDSAKIAVESLGGGGDAGAIGIRVREFLADATNDPNLGTTFTGLLARSKASGKQSRVGRAGNVDVRAETVSIMNTARISADSQGAGSAGTVKIDAQNVTVDGQRDKSFSSITATTGRATNSRAGRIDVHADDTFTIGNGALVRVASTGASTPGDISISGGELRITGGGRLESGSEGTQPGTALNITVRRLQIENGGRITASANDVGRGGVVSINALDSIGIDGGDAAMSGEFSGILAETASTKALAGTGGQILVKTRALTLRDGGQISAASSGRGAAGNVDIQIDGPLRMSDPRSPKDQAPLVTGIFAGSRATGAGGPSGMVSIIARDVLMTGKTVIAASTAGSGNGGDVRIAGEDMRLSGGAQIAAASGSDSGGGPSGDIRIELSGEFESDDSLITVSSRTLRVQAGNIDLRTAGDLRLNNSIISVTSRGTGGNISIHAPSSAGVSLDNSRITARASGSGKTSKIVIDPKTVSLGNRSVIDGTANGVDVEVSIFASGLVKSIDSEIRTDRGVFSINNQLASSTVPLNLNVNDIANRLQPLCVPLPLGELSSFLSLGRGGVSPDPRFAAPSSDFVKQEPDRR